MTSREIYSVKPAWLTQFRIERMTRPDVIGRPDDSGYNPVSIEKLIWDELEERVASEAHGGPSVQAWLKETIYGLILAWLGYGLWDELLERVDAHNRFQRGTKRDDRNIFDIGLVAFFAEHAQVTKQFRPGRVTDPMWFAFRHYIPPPLLNAFNAGYPGHAAKRLDWREVVEPKLEGWVVEQRLYSLSRDCPLDEYRSVYPTNIELAVHRALNGDKPNDWPERQT